MPSVKISASVLNSDLSALGNEVKRISDNGIEYVHFDVMDGEFVENITYGSAVQKSILPHTSAKIDTHLMVMHPGRQAKLFADAGSDIITFHIESECDADALIDEIHSYGVKAGVAVKPNTPAEAVFPYIEKADMVLVMTVEPGYGGQGFIHAMTDKIRKVREEADRLGKDIDIQVDGGINTETAKLVKDAGANVLVAGTFLFKSEDMKKSADSMR
ncbi:MAG: ribulose-phosphate 3-epimerase [Ruminiclostridium sp.]|nr:ribulose-phosphate 3-epimerase [Ruminiclostridium sp.]